jgi:hypothetical protein
MLDTAMEVDLFILRIAISASCYLMTPKKLQMI